MSEDIKNDAKKIAQELEIIQKSGNSVAAYVWGVIVGAKLIGDKKISQSN